MNAVTTNTHLHTNETNQETQNSNIPLGWHSSDDVLNAYEAGQKKGKEELKKDIIAKMKINLKAAQDLSVEIIDTIQSELNIKCKGIHLKGAKSKDFTAIIVLPEKEFLSFERFSKINEIGTNVVTNKQSNNITYSFMFMPSSKSINKSALIADGYNFEFKNVKTKKA